MTRLDVTAPLQLQAPKDGWGCDLDALLAGVDEVIDQVNVPHLQRLFTASNFAAEQLTKHPDWLPHIADDSLYPAGAPTRDFDALLRQTLTGEEDEDAFNRALRLFRHREQVRFIYREFNGLAPLAETTAELSALASCLLNAALAWHYPRLCEQLGAPIGRASGKPQPMVVLGMGKLGAWELNLSSDIDLIFAFPESGETNGARALDNQQFFTRLGQRLIKSLDTLTAEGFCFRVDMRLRPHGDSGALVSNFNAVEDYYQTQGRDWERFAMIKARPVAWVGEGGAVAAEKLMALLTPFTYRRYVDFSAFDSLRNMKNLISREVQRKGLQDDVKLGGGGIREVEFVGQAFQLIRGGRDMALRERRVLPLLNLLAEWELLPPRAAEDLAGAYVFLRHTEHALQALDDRQTQSLPAEPAAQQRLARVMGFADWPAFYAVLSKHRARVHEEFKAVIASPDDEDEAAEETDIQHWADFLAGLHKTGQGVDAEQAQAWLEALGFDAPAAVLSQLQDLYGLRALAMMQASGRDRFDHFMPRLMAVLAQTSASAETLQRVLKLVVAVLRRSAYLVLLIENPAALAQLVTLCAASPWIADQLSRHPALLDELLDTHSLYHPPNRAELTDELRQATLRINRDDLEAQMEALRYFKLAHGLRVAASEVAGVLPLMKVSDYLTWLAEAILDYVQQLAWELMVARHGYPVVAGNAVTEPEFIVVGYGKLGGIELGHGSDLDLVFVHNTDINGYTDGERSLDNQSFYTRMGQKIIHILNTQTISGQVYEVDMRLRPSGNSGLLVTSLTAFEKYQRNEAWTWEHQALVRARVVCGEAALARRFEQLRLELLCQPRDLAKLAADVVAMREKMRASLGCTKAGLFHLKQDAGGIVDIEFMVQYAALAWAHQVPALVRYSDNIRILGCLEEADLMAADDVASLIRAYKAYRSTGHALALQRQAVTLEDSQFRTERAAVTDLWQRLFGPVTETKPPGS
ncbi:bifunctional [glutamate--ammonia ligase]-adenylyl-L-tyrosine phosphorylase/[glutamate--ammonia-ligase] adenylyltransferase [Simiduia sp. 21SJ11W-1]|uniref:bifunctional [glutamate--ammonia ligase]-adenylyl-L-tyrosine phosphorylase/[glutamate--ammonia-ligase] adenylyltransferase n=1 Tax=Simiduia sp. 21SJ11W-1 TaxID=2909669 RepID=UPI00209E5DD9|nr:bifunctional [glutamate--ammonia ligase]-adenylyl-L-tyrosine phosphorylase/[glutamate--ammonia-ligase] adenylyltransferase [Simiduia sp. 21SJ11W-1]UTA48134.1 bifunctional [glutamate--ammonia ligase]-adenylyl-L-tyrosine phosphorylase/[glutamate--ammonia-ligase] adenylyltransferase [Simiduia sp. 21SJ11W-1]